MKKKKNEDRKKTLLLTTLCTTIALCVITILLIVALVKVFTKNNTPYYKVEERVEELNNFTTISEKNFRARSYIIFMASFILDIYSFFK